MSVKKCLISMFVVYLLLCSLFPFTSVEASSSIQPYSYYDIGSFSFKGTSGSFTKFHDGTFMAIEASATSSSGNSYDVYLHVIIHRTNTTKTFKLPSDGKTRKFDYIYLGLSGSSDVSIYCTCDSSDTIQVKITAYSWL